MFLKDAGLEQYEAEFREQGFTFDDLKGLREDYHSLQALIPRLVHRVRFSNALKNIQDSAGSDRSSGGTESESSSSVQSTSSGSSVQILTQGILQPESIVDVSNIPLLLVSEQTEDTECTVIKDILKQSFDGRMVLNYYERHDKKLDPNYKLKLAKAVVCNELFEDFQAEISAHRFRFLADCIHKEFPDPGSGPELWYNPSKTRDKVTSLPSGKLYDKYTVLTKELRKIGARENRRRGNQSSNNSSGQTVHEDILASVPHSNLSAEELQSRLEYLKTEINEWETITKYWTETVRARYEDLTAEGSELLCDYYKKYPALKQPLGYKLLELDFQCLFPDAYGRIYAKWDRFVEKVQEQLNLHNIKLRSGFTDAELLHGFSKLFTPVPLKVSKGRAWKPSRRDILEGFLCHLKADDLEKCLDHVEERNQARGLRLQPFPVVIGPRLQEIETCYLIIDRKPLILNSTKDVFAAAFYSYHALYCSYPVQSARLWVVIERALFGMNNESDPQSQAVSQVPEVKRLINYLHTESKNLKFMQAYMKVSRRVHETVSCTSDYVKFMRAM